MLGTSLRLLGVGARLGGGPARFKLVEGGLIAPGRLLPLTKASLSNNAAAPSSTAAAPLPLLLCSGGGLTEGGRLSRAWKWLSVELLP